VGAVVCAAGLLFWPVEVIMVGFFTVSEFNKLWPTASSIGYLPRIPQFKRDSTRKVVFVCPPMVEFGTALDKVEFGPISIVGWRQDNRNRSNQESKFDFLATRQCLVKIDEGQQKRKIFRTNRQSNLRCSCQSIFSLSRHTPTTGCNIYTDLAKWGIEFGRPARDGAPHVGSSTKSYRMHALCFLAQKLMLIDIYRTLLH